MIVRELIERLKEMPQDAEVVGYNHFDEGDYFIDEVEVAYPRFETYHGEEYIYPPYGCQADSNAEEYWHEHGLDKPIVYLLDYKHE